MAARVRKWVSGNKLMSTVYQICTVKLQLTLQLNLKAIKQVFYVYNNLICARHWNRIK